MNRTQEQDSWSKITLDKYVNGSDRFPKKKTWGMPGTDLYLNSYRIGRRAKRMIYLSTAVWNRLSQGRVDLRPFRSLVLYIIWITFYIP